MASTDLLNSIKSLPAFQGAVFEETSTGIYVTDRTGVRKSLYEILSTATKPPVTETKHMFNRFKSANEAVFADVKGSKYAYFTKTILPAFSEAQKLFFRDGYQEYLVDYARKTGTEAKLPKSVKKHYGAKSLATVSSLLIKDISYSNGRAFLPLPNNQVIVVKKLFNNMDDALKSVTGRTARPLSSYMVFNSARAAAKKSGKAFTESWDDQKTKDKYKALSQKQFAAAAK